MVDLSLLQDFIAETAEYLEDMEGCLLRLEADPGNRMILDDIFRSVHTIKGAAEYLGIEKIAELSRAIENLLYYQLQRSEQTCGREVLDLLVSGRERLERLMRNLEKEEKEPVSIDDLIESIRVVDTTSQISEEIRKVAADENEGSLNDETLADKLAFSENEDDEYDEELFAIFLEQLEEKLTELSLQAAALEKAGPGEQITILDSCLPIIETLRGAANYMGYEQLTSFYELWKSDLESARECFRQGGDEITAADLSSALAGNIAALVNRYPSLNLPTSESASGNDKAANQAIAESGSSGGNAGPDEKAEIPVFQNNGEEESEVSGDILDAYAETGAPAGPKAGPGKSAENEDENLFERLSWSFDNRIKQTTTSHDEEDLVEIESELFSSPETPPDPTRPEPEAPKTPQAPATPPKESPTTKRAEPAPETTAAAAPGGKKAAPTGGVADIMSVFDDYKEENDTELFAIFQELIEEVLTHLLALAGNLRESDSRNRNAILELCREQIDRLNSAANYMGYEHLLSFYENWLDEIAAAENRLQEGAEGFLEQFISETLETKIHSLAQMFPDISLARPDSAPETAAAAPARESDAAAPAATGPEAAAETAVEPETKPEPETETETETAAESPDEEGSPTVFSDSAMLADFIAETQEHLEEMEENLLLLDSDSVGRETLDDIFRSVHTIKGAAEYLGIERISSLTHNLENLLYQLRQDKIKVSREIIDLLMAGWDRVSLLVRNLEEKQTEEAEIDDLLERIRALDRSGGKAAAPMPDRRRPEVKSTREKAATAAPPKTAETAPQSEVPTPPRAAETTPEKSVKRSIRVEAGKIDALMNQVGELVVSRAGFTQILSEMQTLQHELKQNLRLDTREMRQLTGMTTRLSETTTLFEKVINELQGEVMKVRMLPISQLFNRYPRLVYDLVRNTGKQVKLDIEGAETELDKMVIEEISDPLIHIIRNAVDHGIETTEERRRKGKPETGTIKLKAYHEGNHVIIEIIDDGRGLDLEVIKKKALEGNFVSRADLEQMSTQEITGLIMKPGFSTAAKVTHISGRGVGMDVVRKNIEKLNGTIEIDTTPGVEMHFRIKIPLTLAIIPALRVRVSSELFTIPLSTVEETLKTTWDKVFTIEGIEVLSFRESTLPLIRMADLFNLDRSSVNGNQPSQAYIVVVSTGMKRMGLVVDELMGQENVVIKPLEDYIQEKSGFSGATILGDGRISLILDVYELINLAVSQRGRKRSKNSLFIRSTEPVSP